MNADKKTLRGLQLRGVPIPATVWFAPGASAVLEHVMEGHGWEKAVTSFLANQDQVIEL